MRDILIIELSKVINHLEVEDDLSLDELAELYLLSDDDFLEQFEDVQNAS